MTVQSMGEMGKGFCPNILQPFLENIDRKSCNDGSQELNPVFHNPHHGVPCRGALFGRVEREEENSIY